MNDGCKFAEVIDVEVVRFPWLGADGLQLDCIDGGSYSDSEQFNAGSFCEVSLDQRLRCLNVRFAICE